MPTSRQYGMALRFLSRKRKPKILWLPIIAGMMFLPKSWSLVRLGRVLAQQFVHEPGREDIDAHRRQDVLGIAGDGHRLLAAFPESR